MRIIKYLAACVVGTAFVASSPASANIGQTFGFGSRTSSLGGAGLSWGFDGFASYHNPAGLALAPGKSSENLAEKEKRLQLSFGLLYMQPSFVPINNVVTQNAFNADTTAGSPTYANVDTTSYRATTGQEFGFSYRLFPELLNFTFGLVTYLPLNQLAYMDTGESYVPEYVLYRARTQRPQIDLAAGVDLGRGFHVGAGLNFGFSLTSNASVFINTATNTASSMRFTSSLSPKASPYLGFLYAPDGDQSKYSLGAVFRFPMTSDNTMVLNSAARVFGNLAAVDFNFTALSALFYDPMSIEVGGSWQHFEWARFTGQIEYQYWSRFQAPALLIQQPQTTNCQPAGSPGCGTVTIAPGQVPTFTYSDIFVLRGGEEFKVTEVTTVRVGYAYKPSILGGASSSGAGSGNYLDPDTHSFNLGLGLNYRHFIGYDAACRIDFNLAYQYIARSHVTKSAVNESGNTLDPKIGSPGYDVGGNLYGGGVSVSLGF
jgi:long-subunit fatty acid transport protein